MKTASMKNCGCVVPFESLYKANDNTYRCPNHHKNGIACVVADCDGGCGKTLTREHGSYIVIKCHECKARDRKEKDKEYSRRYYKKKKKKAKKIAQLNNIVTARRNHKFDPSLYTKGLSLYIRNSPNE